MISPASIGRTALVLAALAAAWFFTRSRAPAPAAPAGHQHGLAPASAGPTPVLLTDRDQHRIGVTFAPVERGALVRNVRIVAQVAYDETRVTTVASRVEGYVDRLAAGFAGQPVRAGEPLLWISSPMVTTTSEELLLARRLAGDLSGSTTDAQQRAAQLVQASRDRLRRWQLSEADIARIETSGETARGVVLRAPVSGVVLDKAVLPGQRIMEGEALYRIVDLSVVWLEGDVFEQDLAAARVGQPVTAEFPALPGSTRAGRIGYVYPMLNPETRTGRVRVSFANPGLTLRPGMFATIRLATPIAERTLSVPRGAVLSTGERNLVFLKRPDGRFTPTDVTLGVQTEDRLEILRGLAEGDTVVASATFLLDAESNLGSLLGGMGDMPGMDLTAPDAPTRRPVPAPTAEPMPDMPGMEMPPSDSHAVHGDHTGRGE